MGSNRIGLSFAVCRVSDLPDCSIHMTQGEPRDSLLYSLPVAGLRFGYPKQRNRGTRCVGRATHDVRIGSGGPMTQIDSSTGPIPT
jgi:hypothetical protein